MGRSILYSKKSRTSTAQSPKFSIEKNCFLVSFNKDKKLLQNPLQNPTRCAIISHVLRSTANSRPVGQAVKTLASHAEIMGSIPVRVTNQRSIAIAVLFCFSKAIAPAFPFPRLHPRQEARGYAGNFFKEKVSRPSKTLLKSAPVCPRIHPIRFTYPIPIFKVSQGGAGEAFSKAATAYPHSPP